MAVAISKIAALVLAAAYVVAARVVGGLSFAGTVALGTLLPLALIWFPEQIGSWTRRSWYRPTSPSPSFLVATMGWVFLVGLPLFLLLLALKRS